MSIKKKIADLAVKGAEELGELAAKALERDAVKGFEARTLGQIMDTLPPEARAPRRRIPPKVRYQRPHPEDADPVKWVKRARAEAAERYGPYNRLPGKLTASVKGRVELDPRKLENIPGAMGERRVPGDEKYDRLMASVQEKGFDPNTHIWLGINHLGEPYVAEGNTRLAVARDLGIDRIPAEVMWYGGGEQVGGLMEPGLLEHYMPPSELALDPNFRKWFGESKGVDEYGEPRMFYHGSNAWEGTPLGQHFSVFDRMAVPNLLSNRKPSMDNVGSWFSDRADDYGAGQYAVSRPTADVSPYIMPLYLKYSNPWETTFEDFLKTGNAVSGRKYDPAVRPGGFDPEALRQWLKERGHDAIQFPRGEIEGDQNVTVVLEPTQIKSATGNRGTYDPNDPDIRKARGGLAVKR